MAIKIYSAKGTGASYQVSGEAYYQQVDILCDSEADITAFGSGKGHEIAEGAGERDLRVKPTPGSTAYTADGAIGYKLSPSYVWTKFKG